MGMGQRVNPHTIRVGVIKDWNSKWIPDSEYDLEEEPRVRNFSNDNLYCNYSLVDRKIKLQKLLGKNVYKKVTNKVKSLSR